MSDLTPPLTAEEMEAIRTRPACAWCVATDHERVVHDVGPSVHVSVSERDRLAQGYRAEARTSVVAFCKQVYDEAQRLRRTYTNQTMATSVHEAFTRLATQALGAERCGCGHTMDAHVTGGCAHTLPNKIDGYTGRAITQMCSCKSFRPSPAPAPTPDDRTKETR